MGLYHGLVLRLAANNRKAQSTCATNMHVWFIYARRDYVAMADMRHGLAPSNTHSFIVYGQKHKVWVLIFLS